MKFIILFLSLSIRICCSFDVDYANSFQYNRGHNTVLNSIWNIPDVPYIPADHQDNWNYLQQENIYEILFDYSQGCPNTYEPICATNGQQHLYFINSCFLHQRNYQQLLKGQREFEICSMNFCFPQRRPCPDIIRPLCARDMSTQRLQEFKNYCEMELAAASSKKNYRFQNAGSCFPSQQCPRTCSKIYQPVCARYKSEIREFLNNCELQRSRCESKINWSVFNPGPCPSENNAVSVVSIQEDFY